MMGNESKSARSCVVEEFARLTQERDEALATIEALRRRVAELEGSLTDHKHRLEEAEFVNKEGGIVRRLLARRRERLKKHRELIVFADERMEKLEAENAELKRQLEALREDSEVGRLVRELLTTRDHGGFWIERTLTGRYAVLMQAGEICRGGDSPLEALLEALREAEKKGD